MASGTSDRKKINAIQVLPDGSFITAGVKKHLAIWTINGAKAAPKSIVTKAAQGMFFSALGLADNLVFAACSDG